MTKKKDESLSSKADAAFRQAARKVVQRAKQTDTPVVVWKDGQVKEVSPDQFEAIVGETEADTSTSAE